MNTLDAAHPAPALHSDHHSDGHHSDNPDYTPEALTELVDALAARGWAIHDTLVSRPLVQQLRADLLAERSAGHFRPAAIGRGSERQIEPSVRSDELRWLDPDLLLPGWQRYRRLLADYQQRLNQQLFLCIDHFEGHFACYPPGSHYAAHYDRFSGSEERVVTTILYLNEGWEAADGGELRIYQGASEGDDYQAIEPLGGRLVTFISEGCYHGVMPARRDRLSLTGWFRLRTQNPLGIALL